MAKQPTHILDIVDEILELWKDSERGCIYEGLVSGEEGKLLKELETKAANYRSEIVEELELLDEGE